MICDELFLLLMKDSGTPETWAGNDVYGLRAAVLADLAVLGRLSLEPTRNPRFRLVDVSPTGHPALDQALSVLPSRNGSRLRSLPSWGRLKPRDGVVAHLQQAGIIEVSSGGLLNLRTTYPTTDPGPERRLRARLYEVLAGRAPATTADLALLGIVQALGVGTRILPPAHTGLRGGDLRRRIKELSTGDAVASAVGSSVKEVSDAVAVSVIAAGTVAAASG